MKLFRLIPGVALLSVLSVLSACGGNGGTPVAMTPDPAPAPMMDAFYSLVVGQVSTTSEDKEPVAIDALVTTSPEADEPVTL